MRHWIALVCTTAVLGSFGCASLSTTAFDPEADSQVVEDSGAADTTTPSDSTAIDDTSFEDGNTLDTSVPPPIDSGFDSVAPPDTAFPPPDTAPPDTGPTSDGIQCGASSSSPTCTAGSESCCITTTSSGSSYSCLPTLLPTCTGVNLLCDDAADCAASGHPGTVCCGNLVSSGGGVAKVSSGSCQAPSVCTQMQNRVVICDPADPNACPNGGSCKMSYQTLPDYYICR